MIPLRDTNPTRRTPFFTWGLIALNVAAFALWQPHPSEPPPGASEPEVRAFFEDVSFNYCRGAIPAEVTRLEPLPQIRELPDGPAARDARVLIGEFCPQKSVWLSLLTAMFLHGGLVHLGGNMLYLFIFGNNVEDRMGHAMFLLFYLVGGVIATYAHVATDPSSPVPLIGASGAIAAVLGAYIVLYPHARILAAVVFFFITLVELPALVVLGFWFVIQAFQGVGQIGSGVTGGVAWFAHIGGFVFGAAIAWLFYRRPDRRRREWVPPGWEY